MSPRGWVLIATLVFVLIVIWVGRCTEDVAHKQEVSDKVAHKSWVEFRGELWVYEDGQWERKN